MTEQRLYYRDALESFEVAMCKLLDGETAVITVKRLNEDYFTVSTEEEKTDDRRKQTARKAQA